MGSDRLRKAMLPLRRRLGVSALERRLGALAADINRVWELLDGHEARIARLELQIRIATVMAWIEQATLGAEPLVSVIVPTRDRTAVLPRSIESVLAQSYANWELLVCDDGSADDTVAVVGAYPDPRVRHVPGEPAGPAAARNRGLEVAAGELVAYLDDDNRMHPNWLKSVVWAFEQRPETEVLYGAIVIDDTARHHGEPGAEMPSAWLEPYDAARILESNTADASAIAHRAGDPGPRWDEELKTMGDWDFVLCQTVHRDPLMLPAIACFYYTDADNRLTALTEQTRRDRLRIVERARATRGGG